MGYSRHMEYLVSPGSGIRSFIQPGTDRLAYAESGSAALAPWNPNVSELSGRPRSFVFSVDGKTVSTTVATMLRLLWDEFIRNPPRPNEAYTRLGPTNHVILPEFNIPSSSDAMRYPKWDNDFNRALWRHAKNNVPNANVLYFDIERSEAEQRPTPLAMKYAALLLARLRGLNVPLSSVGTVSINEGLVIPWNTSAPLPSSPEAYTLSGGVEVWSPSSTFPGVGSVGGTPTNVVPTGTGGGTTGGGAATGGGTATGGGLQPPPSSTNTTVIIVVIAVAIVLAIAALMMTRRR